MKTRTRALSVCLVVLALALLVSSVKADIITDTPFNITLSAGQSFAVQDVSHESTIVWTVASGSLNASGTVNTDADGGTLTLTSSSSCTLIMNCTNAFTLIGSVYQTIYVYGVTAGVESSISWIYQLPDPPPATPTPVPTGIPTPIPPVPQYFLFVNYTGQGTISPVTGFHYYPTTSTTTVTLYATPAEGWAFNYWLLDNGTQVITTSFSLPITANRTALAVFQEIPVDGEPTPVPTIQPTPIPTSPPEYIDIINVQPFWQYLFQGNFLGFINALYLQAFGLEDIVVGMVLLIIFAPLYIKTKNLLLCSIVWILLGASFVAMVPALAGLAVILLILGIAGVLYKLVKPD